MTTTTDPMAEDAVTTTEVGAWESTDRGVAIVIEQWGNSPWTICVTFGDACATWDDLTAEQARELGVFLATYLPRAADRLEAQA